MTLADCHSITYINGKLLSLKNERKFVIFQCKTLKVRLPFQQHELQFLFLIKTNMSSSYDLFLDCHVCQCCYYKASSITKTVIAI